MANIIFLYGNDEFAISRKLRFCVRLYRLPPART